MSLPRLPPLPPLGALRETCKQCGYELTERNTSKLQSGALYHVGCPVRVTGGGSDAGVVTIASTPIVLPKLGALPPLTPFPDPEADPPSLYGDCPPARVLTADPPWQFGDNTPHKGATDHYKTMSVNEICDFPLPPLADDAVLFLWRVGGGNDKGSLGEDAYGVARAWGFTPKSEMVWRKTMPCKECEGNGYNPPKGLPQDMVEAFSAMRVWCEKCHGRGYKLCTGMGRYVRGAHEVCLIATRGKPQFPDDKSVKSVFDAYRGEHSEKPQRFYERVEQLYKQGPYVELFARRRRKGWYQFGDELPSVGAP